MAPLPVPKVIGGQLSPAKRAQLAATASPSTPRRSPIKQRKAGVTLQQKKTLIENLRLEITERARRLRAQYHLQAQGLRSRIEIRLNRIPMSLRKLKMEDLLLKYMDQEQEQQRTTSTRAQPPSIPLKDAPSRTSPQKPSQQITRTQNAGRPQKHSSDKENDVEHGETTKKRVVGKDTAPVPISQVLSPTSSNTRIANRERMASPTKSYLMKTNSPMKGFGATRPDASSSSLSSVVQKGKGARVGGIRKVTSGSTSSGSATSRPRRAAAAAAPKPLGPRSATRTTRRASGQSDTSESSTNTVIRKIATGKSTAGGTKKATATTKKGVTGGDAKTTDAGKVKSATGRMLRKRG